MSELAGLTSALVAGCTGQPAEVTDQGDAILEAAALLVGIVVRTDPAGCVLAGGRSVAGNAPMALPIPQSSIPIAGPAVGRPLNVGPAAGV
jgi:hypothetical protein